jgi:hypothetical protein
MLILVLNSPFQNLSRGFLCPCSVPLELSSFLARDNHLLSLRDVRELLCVWFAATLELRVM